ncbi:hypothetical protein [Propionivibrio sp.]|uniref:hypothetical protein n=1 Tax=Propionivibrio sp. TaxID=2212460 RepID=UPI003BF298B8
MAKRKRLTDEEKNKIIADWKTGKFTVRDISDKYGVPVSSAHNIVKDVEKIISKLVDKQVELNQEVAQLSEREVNMFRDEVSDRMRHTEFFNSHAIKNVQDAMNMECESQNDFRARADTISKGRQDVLGKSPETAIQINNQPIGKVEIIIVRREKIENAEY